METATNLEISNPESIREQVYRILRQRLMAGEFKPGDRLVEAKLARELSVSRTPVREALHLLEREGLFESIPRVGYQMKRFSWAEVEEICEIRVVNETLAAQWAIRNMSPGLVDELEENQALSESEAAVGNARAFIELDGRFHDTIVRASASTQLIKICDQLRRYMLLYRLESLFNLDTVLGAIQGHRRILDCIRRGDDGEVGRAIREHINFAKRMIRRHAFDGASDSRQADS